MGFKRLTTRFLLIVLALFIVTGLVSTFTLLLAVDGIIHRLGASYALERAEVERSRIANVLETEAVLARKLADSPPIVHWLLDEGNPSLRAAAFEELESFRQAFRDKDYFITVGSSLTYYNQPTTGPLAATTLSRNNPADAWYFDSVEAGVPSTFNLDFDRLIGQAKVWINCIVHAGGRVIGVAGTGIDITDLVDQLVRSEGDGVRTILVDSSGAITAERDRKALEQNALAGAKGKKITIFDLAKTDRDREVLARLMASASAGKPAVALVNLDGQTNLTVITRIPEISWFAVVAVDPSSVIAFIDFLPLFALLVASLLAVLAAISLLMDRVVLRPLATMTSSARRIAAGDYSLALPTGRTDEIGNLSLAFNEMAAKVKGYTEGLESLVERRTAELKTLNGRLEVANRQVMESIRYARLIQDGIMPPEGALASRLSSHALFHRQRDIVGGDFLFFQDFEDGFLLGVIDCAGHGVPGALMTMMASSSLQLIASRVPFDDPASILSELDAVIRASLRQNQDQTPAHSGMDVGLCACLPKERALIYAGAAMPLYLHSAGGAIATISGRKTAIGYQRRRNPGPFENRRLAADGQTFFLVTDGYIDQAGGDQGRAYGTRRLSALFASCDGRALGATNPGWEPAFDAYRGERNQRDDVLAIGFRI